MSYGFNFRATSGFVTDNAGETYSLGVTYPETRNGITFGWDTDITGQARDRNSGVDRRFAGLNQQANSGVTVVFRIDLPATGNYDVSFALGDVSGGQYIDAEVGDNGSYVTIADQVGVLADNYVDATGVTRTSNADWISNQVARNQTFASTILQLRLAGLTSTLNSSAVTHLLLTSTAGAFDAATFQAVLMQTQGGAAMIGRACRGVYG